VKVHKPTYFDSQGQCSSILHIDEADLKEFKRQGCPAFKHGRIYHAPLLEWIAAKKALGLGGAGDPGKEIRRAILDFALQYEREEINFEEFFERTTLLLEALRDQAMLHEWIRHLFFWLRSEFSKLSDAYKIHPRIVDWLCRQACVKYRAPDEKRPAVSQK
jgi:hypothetical protein